MRTTTINVKIDAETKNQAVGILHSLGLNTTQAISLFFRQIIYTKSIPFPVRLPGQETLKAINELETGGGKKFTSVDDFFEDLDR